MHLTEIYTNVIVGNHFMHPHRFSGQTILVTGASAGIGNALSKKLASEGAHVFAASRNEQLLHELSASVQEGIGRITPVKTDIRSARGVQCLFERIDASGDGLDIVVNNAAHGHNNRIDQMSCEEIESVVSTNLLGTILVTREALQRMITQDNKGHIAFVSSLAGRMAFPNLSVYSATKFGIEGLAEAMGEELKGTGVTTAIIRPGITDTNFFDTAKMHGFAQNMAGKMWSAERVADEIANALAVKSQDVTIGPDKYFMPLLKILPIHIARKFLRFFS